MDPTEPHTGIHKIIDLSRYSTLTKLLRVTGYVLRFINNLRDSTAKQTGTLSVTELNTAQFRWIFDCQQQQFPTEIQHLKLNLRNKKYPPLVRQLQLFLDDKGYLRCGGRIHNAPVHNTTKFPYLLPSRHTLTTLIILAAHITQLHGGVICTVTAQRTNSGLCQHEGMLEVSSELVLLVERYAGNLIQNRTLHHYPSQGHNWLHPSPSQGWTSQGLFTYALKVKKQRLTFVYSPAPAPELST